MPPDTDDFEQQVAPLLAEMEASANAHDTDRHLAAYCKDSALIFVINGEVIRGWDALRERQRQWWKGGKAEGVYAYRGKPVFERLGKDLGLTTHVIAARASLPGGEAHERQLAFTALWRRRPEGWRIAYAHESCTQSSPSTSTGHTAP
jgi:ketosteroid isomerase-like protein